MSRRGSLRAIGEALSKAAAEIRAHRPKLPSEVAAAENLLASHIQLLGLPQPSRQYRYVPGRRITADFAFELYRLLVEVQGGIWRRGGGAHSHPIDLERDIEKRRLALLNDWAVLEVTTDEVRNGKAAALVEQVLRKKGWQR